MKRLFYSIYILILLLISNSAEASFISFNFPKLDSLLSIQKQLNFRQDSLQRELNESRSLYTGATLAQRDSLSEVIILLEGSVFDIRAQLAEVGNQIADREETLARENLEQSSQSTSSINSDKIYDAPLFVESLDPSAIELLKNYTKEQAMAESAIEQGLLYYNELQQVKSMYEASLSQQQIDSLKVQASALKGRIAQINDGQGALWMEYFNEVMKVYLIMLDMSPSSDRTLLEDIDRESREIRSEKSLLQQNSLMPNLVAYGLDCQLILDYQKVISSIAELSKVHNALEKVEVKTVDCQFGDIEFGERELTLYSDVIEDYEYGYSKVSEIPEVIIPYKGVYYTVRVALYSTKPQSLSTFRDAGPLQLYKTSEGKFSYQLGGFRTFREAEAGLSKARTIGFRAPAIVAYIDGELSTVDKAKLQQEKSGADIEGGFKVVLKTKNAKDGDVLRSLMDENTKGKSILRINQGDMFVFSVITFTSMVEAEEFLLSLRSSITQGEATVEQINL